jgi:hypothetical protein
MMRAFLDDVRYELGGRRVVLTLRKPSGTERRLHTRFAFQDRVRVAPIRADGTPDWDAAYEAVGRNLSEDGMAFLQSRLAASERIVVGIYTEGGPIYLPAEVRHCEALTGDVVELGCRFQLPTGSSTPGGEKEDALDRAISDLVEQSQSRAVPPSERRVHPRIAYTGRITIADRLPGEPEVGFARDLSKGGIAFITTGAIAKEVRRLVLPTAADKPPLVVRVEIVRCERLMGEFFDMGARFLGLAEAD